MTEFCCVHPFLFIFYSVSFVTFCFICFCYRLFKNLLFLPRASLLSSCYLLTLSSLRNIFLPTQMKKKVPRPRFFSYINEKRAHDPRTTCTKHISKSTKNRSSNFSLIEEIVDLYLNSFICTYLFIHLIDFLRYSINILFHPNYDNCSEFLLL